MASSLELRSVRISADRDRLGRVSTAERVADILREHITEGALLPGTRLSEEALREQLPVSRNTLREAFRLLSHERLLVHEFNRGVFVRRPTVDEVIDLYRLRRLHECFAVREATEASEQELGAVRAAVTEGEQAAGEQRWLDVGTANMHFHQALTALAGSPLLDEIMRRLLAEGRLAFHEMGSALRQFHDPYLELNRRILELLEAGALDDAEAELRRYLDGARDQLVAAFQRNDGQKGQDG